MSKKKRVWGCTGSEAPANGPEEASGEMFVDNNHIYFTGDIDDKSILKLRQSLQRTSLELLKMQVDFGDAFTPEIFLHINSSGGYVTDGFSGLDAITSNKVKITSIVEGHSASAATLLSVGANERWISKHSVLLIHQIRGGVWGTQKEIEDETYNWKIFEKQFINFYSSRTNLLKKDVKKFLSTEKYFTAEECLNKGFVDKII